jgi:hypothetical protein
MERKSLLILLAGFVLGIGFCAAMGFDTARTETRMLVPSSNGGAYYFNGKKLLYVTGGNATTVSGQNK